MKPDPAPRVPGDTPAERMSNALHIALSVSKDDLLKAEKKWKRERTKKRAKKKAH